MSKHPVGCRVFLYWDWVRSEATLIDTDGCSNVLGIHVDCCYEHDLAYFYGADPRDAYRHYREGARKVWDGAVDTTRAEADRRFRKCLQARSKFGRYSPMAAWRWVGVRIGGYRAWNGYRGGDGVEKAA